MKIGILTHYYKSINYGGVLQSYALCKYLNEQGYSAFQISYKSNNKSLIPTKYTLLSFVKKILDKGFKIILKKQNSKIKLRMDFLFENFRNQIPHSDIVYDKNTISNVVNDLDAIIVGSDQVWNPKWFDSSYMLDFVKIDILKVSYAASMGVNLLTKEQERIYKKHLENFDYISVREDECATCLGSFINKGIQVCVDPTLLLSPKEWDSIASERIIDDKYVFLYMLGDDTALRRLANDFAVSKGLKLVFIPNLLGSYRIEDAFVKGESILNATPHDFLSLIKHAEYIFTDSFHACVFSLVFHKEFFAFERNRKSDNNTSSRIYNLMRIFDCPNHFLTKSDELNLNHIISCKSIDYSDANPNYEFAKNKSMEFLKIAIESTKKDKSIF